MGGHACGTFVLDTDGRVVSWNVDGERIGGYKAEEVIGRHFSVFYPPESVTAEYPQSALEQAVSTGFHIDDGWRVRKDGTRYWAHVFTTPQFDANWMLVGFIRVVRDNSAWPSEQ